jgi:hypothetical protein
VTESVATTRGPNDRWNVAALGLHAPDGTAPDPDPSAFAADDPVTATTWGRTRTWRNFRERDGGVVQFVTDPRDFVDAALSVREEPDPVLDSAAAWVRVEATSRGHERVEGARRERWALAPTESAVRERRVPTHDRGFAAVVDATVAASRLDVDAYESAALRDRLRYFETVVDSCGGPRVREAFARVDEYADWR